jgi:rubrerythrin
MTNVDKLAEHQIREHEARLAHLDDLMEQAGKEAEKSGSENVHKELDEIKEERGKMADYIEELKTKSPEQFMEAAGPMVMWELVAKRLEKLIERIKSE